MYKQEAQVNHPPPSSPCFEMGFGTALTLSEKTSNNNVSNS